MPGFVLLVHPRDDGDAAMRIGITVTKKVGNAVVRNRIKRRFRALARAVLPQHGLSGADHVLIGRGGAIEREWATLEGDLAKALAKTRAPGAPADGARRGGTARRSGTRAKAAGDRAPT
jgi:ribonuclease P protein component